MVALLTALIPLLQALIRGGSLASMLSSVTTAQWEALATQLLQGGPSLLTQLPQLIGQLFPHAQAPLQNMTTTLSNTQDPTQAATSVQSWLAANGAAAIQEYPGTATA